MTFTTGIPQPSQSLNQTQQPIQDNFTVLNNTISENHVAMNVVGAGKHKYVVMPRVTSGTPTTLAAEGTIFTRIGSSEQTNLYYSSDAGGIRIQLTRAIDAQNASFSANSALPSSSGNGGWTFLPGGLIMMYGTSNGVGSSGTVKYPFSFTTVYSLTVSLDRGAQTGANVDYYVTNSTTSQFSYSSNNASSGVAMNFIAIGV